MKHLYYLPALLAVTLGAFTANAEKTVTINCEKYESIEVRDGGAEGTLVEITSAQQAVEFTGDVYIKINPEKIVRSLTYTVDNDGYTYQAYANVLNNEVTIPLADMAETPNIYVYLEDPQIVYLNVPDPSLITVKKNSYSTEEYELVAGRNELKCQPNGSLYITPKNTEEYRLKKVYMGTEADPGQEFVVTNYTYCYVQLYIVPEGTDISYELIPASELVLPKFYVTIDKPDEVNFQVDWVNQTGFEAGVQKAVEMSSSQASVTVSCTDYSKEIYKVIQNGVELEPYYGRYQFTANENDEIEVYAEWPDIDYTVSITVNPAECAAFVTGVELADVPAESWSEPMTIKAGTTLNIRFDTGLYKMNSATINGEDKTSEIYGSYSTTVKSDLAFVFDVEKYQTLKATLHVDDPDSFTATYNYSTPIALHEGDIEIEFVENAKFLQIKANENYILNKVCTTVDNVTTELTPSWGSVSVSLQENMYITVDCVPMVFDMTASLFVADDPTDKTIFSSFNMTRGYDYKDMPLAQGYTIIEFNDLMTQYSVRAYDTNWNKNITCYVNGEELTYNYGYTFNLVEGDALKIYTTTPEKVDVTFEVEDGTDVEILRNRIQPVVATDGFNDFAGTEVRVVPTNPELSLKVVLEAEATTDGDAQAYADDEVTVEPDENGIYVFNVDANTKVKVTFDEQSGIGSISAPKAGNDIYTVSGILVKKNASSADVKALPEGLYIINGKKCVVR